MRELAYGYFKKEANREHILKKEPVLKPDSLEMIKFKKTLLISQVD